MKVVVPRPVVERLRELAMASDRLALESASTLLGIKLALGIEGDVTGWEDGDEPALLVTFPASEPPSSPEPAGQTWST